MPRMQVTEAPTFFHALVSVLEAYSGHTSRQHPKEGADRERGSRATSTLRPENMHIRNDEMNGICKERFVDHSRFGEYPDCTPFPRHYRTLSQHDAIMGPLQAIHHPQPFLPFVPPDVFSMQYLGGSPCTPSDGEYSWHRYSREHLGEFEAFIGVQRGAIAA